MDWFIDAAYDPEELLENCKMIREFIESPLDENGKKLHKLIRLKKKPAKKRDASEKEDAVVRKAKEQKKFISAQVLIFH
jgi:hypothetical protein